MEEEIQKSKKAAGSTGGRSFSSANTHCCEVGSGNSKEVFSGELIYGRSVAAQRFSNVVLLKRDCLSDVLTMLWHDVWGERIV